jgi:hypothetical protein
VWCERTNGHILRSSQKRALHGQVTKRHLIAPHGINMLIRDDIIVIEELGYIEPKGGQFPGAVSTRLRLGPLKSRFGTPFESPSGSRRSPSRDGSARRKASLATLGAGCSRGLAPRARAGAQR